jgi:hypothetical protein
MLKQDMFRPLLGHQQVYCLCLRAELVFCIRVYIKKTYFQFLSPVY